MFTEWPICALLGPLWCCTLPSLCTWSHHIGRGCPVAFPFHRHLAGICCWRLKGVIVPYGAAGAHKRGSFFLEGNSRPHLWYPFFCGVFDRLFFFQGPNGPPCNAWSLPGCPPKPCGRWCSTFACSSTSASAPAFLNTARNANLTLTSDPAEPPSQSHKSPPPTRAAKVVSLHQVQQWIADTTMQWTQQQLVSCDLAPFGHTGTG